MLILLSVWFFMSLNSLSNGSKSLEINNGTTLEYEYLLVLDFEATCFDAWQRNFYIIHPEIIEFSCILYNVEQNKSLAEFRQYVKPDERPRLSEFCKNLTGIQQHQVDSGIPLRICLMYFKNWLEKQESLHNFSSKSNKFASATWTNWDLGYCLRRECMRKQIGFPSIFTCWIDVRDLFVVNYHKPKNFYDALVSIGLPVLGRWHSGLDDAKNTINLIAKMVADGIALKKTSYAFPIE